MILKVVNLTYVNPMSFEKIKWPNTTQNKYSKGQNKIYQK